MIYDHTVGTTVHFGPHALLPPECMRLLLCLLRCRKCQFRAIYHRMSVDDIRINSSVLKAHRTSQIIPFHSLERAMKAVLQGLQIHRNGPKSFIIQTRSETSISNLQTHTNYHMKAVVHTTFIVKEKPLVCPIHGHEIVNIFYSLGDEENKFTGIGSQLNSLILKGRSEFFRSVISYEENHTSDDELCKIESRCPHICRDKCNEPSEPRPYASSDSMKTYTGLTSLPFEGPAISDANRRWSSFYGCDCTEFRDSSCSIPTEPCKRRVHFPVDNPVSSVHILRTYATACQLERRDHTWLFEARRSFLEQCNQLSSDACESDANSDNPQPCVSAVTTELLPSTSTIHILTSGETDSVLIAKPQSRRKKRRRKRGSLKLLHCPSPPQIPMDCDIKLMYLDNTDPKHCTVLIAEPSN